MSETTDLPWCDSTCDPTMGCNGCYLWPEDGKKICYAGKLHERYGGKSPDYPPTFGQVTLFPGRMGEACRWPDLRGLRRWNKPWLDGLPRIICISDLSEALSEQVSFEFLEMEIIDNVASELGRRHQWAWLTRETARMAKFSDWLKSRGTEWPENLWAGANAGSDDEEEDQDLPEVGTGSNIQDLLEVGTGSTIRFLSAEPDGSISASDLRYVDWVIIGGFLGSKHSEGYDRFLEDSTRCREAGVPCFLNRLGKEVDQWTNKGRVPWKFQHPQGADWTEWPEELRIRQMPDLSGKTIAGFVEGGKREILSARILKKRYDDYFPLVLQDWILLRRPTKPRQQASYAVFRELPSRKEYGRLKVEKYTTTVKSLMDKSRSIVEELADELEQIFENTPESLQQTSVSEARQTAAEALREVADGCVDAPREVENLAVVFFPHLGANSRQSREAEAAEMLATIAETVKKYKDGQQSTVPAAPRPRKTGHSAPIPKSLALDDFLERLEEALGSLGCIEIPGMFG